MSRKKPWAWLDTETTGFKPSEGARVLQVSVRVTDDACRDVTRGGRFTYTTDIQIPLAALIKASPKALQVNHFANVVTIESLRELPEDERPRIACGEFATQFASNAVLESPGARVKRSKEYQADNLVAVMADPAAYFNAPLPHVAWEIVHTMISGCHLVCQNLPFDKPFVENELALAGLTMPCDFRGIEIMSLSNLLSQHLGQHLWGLDFIHGALVDNYGFAPQGAHRADADVNRMMDVYKFVRSRFMSSFELERRLETAQARIKELEEKATANL